MHVNNVLIGTKENVLVNRQHGKEMKNVYTHVQFVKKKVCCVTLCGMMLCYVYVICLYVILCLFF